MSGINNELILKCVSRWFVNIENNKRKKKIEHVHVHVTMENSNGNLGNGLLVDPSHIILKHKKPSKTSKGDTC